jgi:hypothetical protein
METKEELVNNIKEWIKNDTEISNLKLDIKNKNKNKKLLTESLVKVMKTNKIDCFDINGGSLVYKTNKVKKSINSKMLLTSLQKYYKNEPNIAEELVKHIMDDRQEEIKETIKRKIDNK